jgi:sugar phosphate isomerase/epimerase
MAGLLLAVTDVDVLDALVPEAGGLIGVEVGRLRGVAAAEKILERVHQMRGRGTGKEGRPRFLLGVRKPLYLLGGEPCPAVMSSDDARRQRAYEDLEAFLAEAGALGADYVVFGFPWPPVLRRPDEPPWRLDGVEPLVAHSAAATEEHAAAFFAWASGRAASGAPAMFVANSGPNPHVYRSQLYPDLLRRHPAVGFCLDIATLHLHAAARFVDEDRFVEALAPLTGLVRVGNARLCGKDGQKMPALPELRPGHGWADVPALLSAVIAASPGCRVTFDAGSDMPPARQVAALRWVREMVESRRGRDGGSAIDRWVKG